MTEVEERLVSVAVSSSWPGYGGDKVLEDIANPYWLSGDTCWEGCVPEQIEQAWPLLSLEAKLIAYALASEIARMNSHAYG